MEIRLYEPDEEVGWVRCRTLSFLDTAYFDNVLKKKEKYQNPAIELVAIQDGQVIGLLDIEYEKEEKTVCTGGYGLVGMFWYMSIHLVYQRMGVGTQFIDKDEALTKQDYKIYHEFRMNN